MCGDGATYNYGLVSDNALFYGRVTRRNDLPAPMPLRQQLKKMRWDKRRPELYRAISGGMRKKRFGVSDLDAKKGAVLLYDDDDNGDYGGGGDYGDYEGDDGGRGEYFNGGGGEDHIVGGGGGDDEIAPDGYNEMCTEEDAGNVELEEEDNENDDGEKLEEEEEEDNEPAATPTPTAEELATMRICCFCKRMCFNGLAAHAECVRGPSAW